MKANAVIIILLIIATFLQFFLKIAFNTTLLTYIAIVLVLVPRVMFSVKIFGIPVSIKVMYALEAIGMALPSLFFFLSLYSSNQDIYWGTYAICILISISIVIMYAVEDSYFIYEETEITWDID